MKNSWLKAHRVKFLLRGDYEVTIKNWMEPVGVVLGWCSRFKCVPYILGNVRPMLRPNGTIVEWQLLRNANDVDYNSLFNGSPSPGRPIEFHDVIRFHPDDVEIVNG